MTTVTVEKKSPVKSKTVWINGLTTAAGVITAATGMIPPPALPYVLVVQGLINIALRFMTTQPIK